MLSFSDCCGDLCLRAVQVFQTIAPVTAANAKELRWTPRQRRGCGPTRRCCCGISCANGATKLPWLGCITSRDAAIPWRQQFKAEQHWSKAALEWCDHTAFCTGERNGSLFCKCCVVEWHLDILVSLRESVPVLQVHSLIFFVHTSTYEHLQTPCRKHPSLQAQTLGRPQDNAVLQPQ